jgi:starch phosphorylase
MDNDMAGAGSLAEWKARIESHWHHVSVRIAPPMGFDGLHVGDTISTRAHVNLAGLRPEDVAVELYVGGVDPSGDLTHARAVAMRLVSSDDGRGHLFESQAIECETSGLSGYTVRVRPDTLKGKRLRVDGTRSKDARAKRTELVTEAAGARRHGDLWPLQPDH